MQSYLIYRRSVRGIVVLALMCDDYFHGVKGLINLYVCSYVDDYFHGVKGLINLHV